MTFTTRPELAGTFGMVSSTHWLPASAGMAVLERGGNAFDAVVAAGFVLQVVEPHQNGPGGDLPALFARAGDRRPTVLCAQGPAPAAATVQAFRDRGLDMVPGSGLLAAAIPGATVGWLTLLRDHGTMRLTDVISYAIGYARNGYPLTPKLVEYIANVEQLFREHWRTSADLYLPGSGLPKAGQVFRNPALADTYERLVEAEGAVGAGREAGIEAAIRSWSEGFVAAAMAKFATSAWRDSSGRDHAGLLTTDDLAGWRPTYEEPVSVEFAGHRVYKAGAWSQGPVLLQQLALLQGIDVTPGSADYVHTVVEGAKLAFADRDAWYGDTSDVPLATLLSAGYASERRALLGAEASHSLRPGSPDGRTPRLPTFAAGEVAADGSIGEPNAAAPRADGTARSDTVHVDVVDRWGNMVAAMPSGGWLHSSPVIPELGFCLGTRLQMAWLDEGLPNTLAPGKRSRTTLSPTLVMRDDEPVLAFGSPGGDQQDQWQLGLLLHHLLGGADLQAAIDAPAFHSVHFPSSFYPHEARPGVLLVEDRLGDDVIADLTARGHLIERAGDWSLGRLCAVARRPDNGTLHAAANPRGMQGYAVGR
ncbi:MAG: gamma-glutamyltransferase family protein [Streptosporangiales bacterium]|nr:gamma-glutamyltransferase family protein [Streptosporangiales bacterium]